LLIVRFTGVSPTGRIRRAGKSRLPRPRVPVS
jgi:hypothetical protein